uniref:Cyclin C-terminal domain-containing protein n=1 Tax=Nymphaea colorata TaxID=210225 RepID=A0A5K1GE27_9MAGN
MENLVFFFAEMSLVEYCMIAYCPSILAASAVYAARCTLHRTPLWTETLKRHTSYPEQQLRYVHVYMCVGCGEVMIPEKPKPLPPLPASGSKAFLGT